MCKYVTDDIFFNHEYNGMSFLKNRRDNPCWWLVLISKIIFTLSWFIVTFDDIELGCASRIASDFKPRSASKLFLNLL